MVEIIVPNNAEIKQDFAAMNKIRTAIKEVLKKIGKIQILDECLAPEGLKPLARSVSWLVEQVVVQNLRKYKAEFGIEYVRDPPSNVSLYDCAIKFNDRAKIYYTNIKTSSVDAKKGKDDISKADKLIKLYEADSKYALFVAVVKIIFKNTTLILHHPNNLIIFNVSWIPDIYCNPRNNNLQSKDYAQISFRSNADFVTAIKKEYATSLKKKKSKEENSKL